MNLQGFQKLLDVAQIAQILLDKAVYPRLEAFSGNAIYFSRGMPAVKKYWTVKEVCALTGLTRKHLYYFHHEGIVRAAAYENYSVAGYDGYKLYDDIAVEKLQQISLYYQLGLKRNEIKALMLSPDYDCNRALYELLRLQWEKKLHIERRIAALEELILIGVKNGVGGALRGISMDDLGHAVLEARAASTDARLLHSDTPAYAETFMRKLSARLLALGQIDESSQALAKEAALQDIFDLGNEYLDTACAPFMLGLFISVLGEGVIAQDLSDCLTSAHGRAAIQYMLAHPELFRNIPHASGSEDKIYTDEK